MTDKQSAENGRFAPGNKGGPGRPKGSPNKSTAEIKAALIEAFAVMQSDPSKPYALAEWAKANPDRFYPLVASRLIPSESRVDSRVNVRREGDLKTYSEAELIAIIQEGEAERAANNAEGA